MFSLMSLYTVEKSMFQTSTTKSLLNATEDLLIDTPGCIIQNYSKTLKFKEALYENKTCGHRAIFVNRIEQDALSFNIQQKAMYQYSKGKSFSCCYKFASRSTVPGNEDTKITFTPCNIFQNGSIIKLEQEILSVYCSLNEGKTKPVIYEDAYFLLKKLDTSSKVTTRDEKSWNVLIIGMDTMSRARVYSTMPHTVEYFEKHKWLDFRGYQKVGFNTFPNIMSLLTGKKMPTIYKACAKGMNECNELMMWSKYKDVGYFTAYGEEYLRLPDTFSRHKGFKIPPTNHYARPFFLTGEKKSGNYICTGKQPSAIHLLDYALDFARAYINENFFGMFWLNSFSHNTDNMPALLDNDMLSFLEKLEHTGALNNTFIIFLSDHGIRYGEMRLPIESYYEERLPMLFMWVPLAFQETYFEEYHNTKINQYRLITPYDLHSTMWHILKLSNDSIQEIPSEACPQCSSLFLEKTIYRTCSDAGVSDKWCSCHNMAEANEKENNSQQSLKLAVTFIKNRTQIIETTRCMECAKLTLKTVLRHHVYSNGTKEVHIIAFMMSPGDVAFEANILTDDNEIKILEPTETISAYNTRGNCVVNPNDRSYCNDYNILLSDFLE
ncbi:unnamed protein product [Parnassius apollo]|uniref:(apollo) hypothetical protein n=1 Tax=Parnassius apollo TaxID=110799 RepID=A0A8S3XAA3_PARAO|nr:unnamed protein product [Parnassius apollo]